VAFSDQPAQKGEGVIIMSHKRHELGVARQIGSYSDATEVAANLRWLMTSGTPGLSADGDRGTLPTDIEGQAEIAWRSILQLLEQANMAVNDIVKVTQYLTRAEDIPAYAKVRSRYLRDVRPAFMLLVVPQLVWPEMLVEVEVVAARA
jgi:Putative translation initiation inhibitor, yjgF family